VELADVLVIEKKDILGRADVPGRTSGISNVRRINLESLAVGVLDNERLERLVVEQGFQGFFKFLGRHGAEPPVQGMPMRLWQVAVEMYSSRNGRGRTIHCSV
jgi:hypothetical protein